MTSLIHEFKMPLPAERTRVFSALTEASQLKGWFADNAEIEPREGGAFHFWGRHAYATHKKSDATQRIRRFEPPSRLTFTWDLHGQKSEVDIELATQKDDQQNPTLFSVRHTFPQALNIGRAKELVEDLWRLHYGNLYLHLLGREPTRPDFTSTEPQITLSIVIDAPRERVFKALLNPETLNKWIASAATVEPRKGGRYTYGWSYKVGDKDVVGGPTKILDLVENEKLVTDWPDWRGDPAVPTQTITWLLEPAGPNATKVTLVHSGFVRTADISDYMFGWGDFLDKLKAAT
jgi:uncharacterized protein YndB with AHSA1/START domain